MDRPHKILNFDVMAVLGEGARSTIYAVKDKKNNVFALKRVINNGPQDQRFVDQAVSEHNIAYKLNHDTLRKSFKIMRQRSMLRTAEIYVLMELVDGMTLEQYQFQDIHSFCQIMSKVAEGLKAMHDSGYVHADIKPNNIMVDDKQVVKIIDFGQSCPIGTVKPRIQGTPDYIAPEQVKRKAITPETDVYNLGATMYYLLTKQHVPSLMPSTDTGVTLRTVGPFKSPRELNPAVPPALASLVMGCVQMEPTDRPSSMSQVVQRLNMALGQLERSADGVEFVKPAATV